MAMIPRYFSASTDSVAEKALERGYLSYPAICFIRSTNTLAWVTMENQIQYVNGNNQITDIQYIGTDLVFYSGDKILFAYNVAMSPEDAETIIQEITDGLNLNEYAKSADVSRLLDDAIGNLEDKATVVDYINSLSYNTLLDKPIINLIGTLTNIIHVAGLSDGIYKIKGQFFLGGTHTTVQSSAEDNIFIISHSGAETQITQLGGRSIQIYFIFADGSYVSDRYITEKWISEQDFITSASVKDYVREIVTDTVVQIIDETLDTRLDVVLDNKLGGISSEDIQKIFQKGK